MIFDANDYAQLATLFDAPGYAGYKPAVLEAPNGDQHVDRGKRYLHVALKYDPPEWAVRYLARAHWEACKIAEALGVTSAMMPRVADGTLRVLEYPPGVGSAPHTDFDLLTVGCYRSGPGLEGELLGALRPWQQLPDDAIVIGELGALAGLNHATRHWVVPQPIPQHSIVYFAMPSHDTILPDGQSVGQWLQARMSRSRVYK